MKSERGSALVIAMIIMALLAALIIGFSRNTDIDLFISRNTRLMKQAFLWSDGGVGLAQEFISISENWAGLQDNSTFQYNFDADTIDGTMDSKIFNSTNTNIVLKEGSTNTKLADINIKYLGNIVNDGSSIVFGAGYEGVGKGAGAGGTIARIYSIRSEGYSDTDSIKRTAAIYRSVSSGK